jgi:hypothetical protein
MNYPISISPDALCVCISEQQELILRLQPFIKQVAREVSDGRSLKEAARNAAKKYKDLSQLFSIDDDSEIFGLRREYLFPRDLTPLTRMSFISKRVFKESRYDLREGAEASLGRIQNLLRLCGSGIYSKQEILGKIEDPAVEMFETFLETGIATERHEAGLCFQCLSQPGVFRLQHSTLLIRSERAGILLDPVLNSTYDPPGLKSNFSLYDLNGLVDAILISHSHEDHYYLPTLMSFPREIPIVVPRVPTNSIICEDLEQRLRTLGFKNVIAPEWYSPPFLIGDIEVCALPFFGEQPLRRGILRDRNLRNWGNTYFIRTDQYSCWCLIDSGDDPLGSASEVARHVNDRFGGVDLLLCNLREFYPLNPMYIGAGTYWLSLLPDQMENFGALENECLSLGPQGAAEVCRVANARKYLPYAHLWSNIGERPQAEPELLADLKRAFEERDCATQIVPWRIGQGYVATRPGRFELAALPQRGGCGNSPAKILRRPL